MPDGQALFNVLKRDEHYASLYHGKPSVRDYAVPTVPIVSIVYLFHSVCRMHASVRTDAYSGKAPTLIPEASAPFVYAI